MRDLHLAAMADGRPKGRHSQKHSSTCLEKPFKGAALPACRRMVRHFVSVSGERTIKATRPVTLRWVE